MRLGESHNDEAARWGRPLDGLRVLSLEQMQALPFATQMMARLGAEIIKVEPPGRGDSGRASAPAVTGADGEQVGATFLRNNLNKQSVAIDVEDERGRQLVLDLASHVDVFCENLGPGRAARVGLGYEDLRRHNPRLVYLAISGFGTTGESPYKDWPAYASVPEAMSGIYEYSRMPNLPPVINPMGAVGDTGTALYALVGVLAALRHRDRTGEGQLVDVAMYDAMLSLCDLAYNYSSLGLRREAEGTKRLPLIVDGFRAADGWVVVQVGRRHQFERLARLVGHPEWLGEERFATGWGWGDHFETVVRPALETWAASKTIREAATTLAEAGLPAAPCYAGDQVADDPHVVAHRMIVEIPRTDGVDQPVLVAGNPIKLSKMTEGPDIGFPRLGEHTDVVLADLLGLPEDALAVLHQAGVLGSVPRPAADAAH